MALIYLVITNLFGKFIYELWIDDVSININHFLILFISIDAVIISFLNLLTAPFKSFNNLPPVFSQGIRKKIEVVSKILIENKIKLI